MAKISVIIPIDNVKKYLRECLDGFKSQTLNNVGFLQIHNIFTNKAYKI